MDQNKGDEMMPRSAFWAPITASRYLSLFDVNGDDDFFSSDLTDEELVDRLGHVGKCCTHGLQLIAAFSKKDEYVPESVDKDILLKRLVSAMNANIDGEEKMQGGRNVARGFMLENGNHNLSGDAKEFVDAFGSLLKLN